MKRARILHLCIIIALGVCWLGAGCRSPGDYREDADRVAYDIVEEAQRDALGRTEPFTVEPPSETLRRRLLLDAGLPYSDPASLSRANVERIPQWPDPAYAQDDPDSTALDFLPESGKTFVPTLLDTLQIAARSSREYQDAKEAVFEAALRLDLERDAFRSTWAGRLDALLSTDGSGEESVSGIEGGPSLGVEKALKTGGAFALDLGVDLVKLLTQDKDSSFGILADATLTLPLLRGSGRFVVTEPLTQAERDVVYAIYGFERFKRTFAVQVASDYLGVVRQLDEVENIRDSYERLVLSTRRAQRLAEAGQLPAIQVDQARQDELRARNRWVGAQIRYERSLDEFKVLLGLPADAAIELDRNELARLTERAATLIERSLEMVLPKGEGDVAADDPVVLREMLSEGGGPMEVEEVRAVWLALEHRLDLRTRIGAVFDAQRAAAVAADRLRADLTLLGRGSAGEARNIASAGADDAELNLSEGRYSAFLGLDLPLERTAERNLYRTSLIDFEEAVRAVQELEDGIKLSVRNELRTLRGSRESVAIQAAAVEVARRRRDSTAMFLEAGRAEIRDVLEAEEALLSAQNALSAALVNYRVGELEIQRDMGVLEVDEQGLWREYVPVDEQDDES